MINIGGLNFNSFDYILVVDREYSVIYNTRYDNRVNITMDEYDKYEILNKNIFEVYPSLKKETSSIVKCITTGEIVIKNFQKYKDFTGRIYCTHNVTVPLIRKGKIMGAVELVKDITTIDNVNNENIDEDIIEFADFTNNLSEITFDKIKTNDNIMLKTIEQAKVISKTKNPTLVYGETGTGKEVFVQAMINYNGISRKKVVIQNCAAIPQNLIESILFGTYKGAYTGSENRKGLFEEADNGIIFLDEFNSIPYDVQGKLLRVLQDGSFRPVGSNIEKFVNTKIIAAMNIDPLEAIEKKQLRSDLFYRLSSSMIYLPPLRERKKDIMLFVNNYIREFNNTYDKNIEGITKKLEGILLEYNWDGNIRELKHIIESMISVSDSKLLDIPQLPAYMYDRVYKQNNSKTEELNNHQDLQYNKDIFNLKRLIEEREIETIKKVLKITKGNKTKAGEILGIPRQTLKYKIDKLNIKL